MMPVEWILHWNEEVLSKIVILIIWFWWAYLMNAQLWLQTLVKRGASGPRASEPSDGHKSYWGSQSLGDVLSNTLERPTKSMLWGEARRSCQCRTGKQKQFNQIAHLHTLKWWMVHRSPLFSERPCLLQNAHECICFFVSSVWWCVCVRMWCLFFQAIETLLISDNLFRCRDVAQRKKFVKLVDDVREFGGDVKIFSSMHVSGEQLDQLTGVCAILRWEKTLIYNLIAISKKITGSVRLGHRIWSLS